MHRGHVLQILLGRSSCCKSRLPWNPGCLPRCLTLSGPQYCSSKALPEVLGNFRSCHGDECSHTLKVQRVTLHGHKMTVQWSPLILHPCARHASEKNANFNKSCQARWGYNCTGLASFSPQHRGQYLAWKDSRLQASSSCCPEQLSPTGLSQTCLLES